MACEIKDMRENIKGYKMPDGRWLNVIAEGRLVNLAAGDGHPAEIMDMSFALQALSLKYMVQNHKQLVNKVYAVPEEIDNRVALVKLESLGVTIDELTEKQKLYLQSSGE